MALGIVRDQIVSNESIYLNMTICDDALDVKSFSLSDVGHGSSESQQLTGIAVTSIITLSDENIPI